MDETIKILIGTISGFIVAFFAEPIKIYFQNENQKRLMRKAIYYEIFQNHAALGGFLDNIEREKIKSEDIVWLFRQFIKLSLRKECYTFYLSNNASLLYQIKEASQVHIIYLHLNAVIEEFENENVERIKLGIKGYLNIVQLALRQDSLEKRMMESAIGKKRFFDLMHHQ